MENGPFMNDLPIKMVIFHSYVNLQAISHEFPHDFPMKSPWKPSINDSLGAEQKALRISGRQVLGVQATTGYPDLYLGISWDIYIDVYIYTYICMQCYVM